MARQGKTLPARRPRSAADESLLIRSAESLGRMIGSLQRQLDGASKKFSPDSLTDAFRANGHESGRTPPATPRTAGTRATAKASGAKAKTAKGTSKSGATNVRSTTDRKSKRESKAAVSSKSAGRSRTAAKRQR
jgi:hypothetical protein